MVSILGFILTIQLTKTGHTLARIFGFVFKFTTLYWSSKTSRVVREIFPLSEASYVKMVVKLVLHPHTINYLKIS